MSDEKITREGKKRSFILTSWLLLYTTNPWSKNHIIGTAPLLERVEGKLETRELMALVARKQAGAGRSLQTMMLKLTVAIVTRRRPCSLREQHLASKPGTGHAVATHAEPLGKKLFRASSAVSSTKSS